MKIDNVTLDSMKLKCLNGKEGAYVRARLVLHGTLNKDAAKILKATGCLSPHIKKFTVSRDKLLEFGGDKEAHSLQLSDMAGNIALTIPTVSVHELPAKNVGGEFKVALTVTLDAGQIKLVAGFFVDTPYFSGSLALEATQGELDFSPPRSPEEVTAKAA